MAERSGTQKQGGEVEKTGNRRSKVPLFLGIVRVKVPLVGDRIERSEDFLFVPLRARTRQLFFVFLSFTSSPTGCKLQILIMLWVKVFAVLCSRSAGDF